MAQIYNKKTHEVRWDDPAMFLKVEESFWELNEYLAARTHLDGHMMDVQWYMAVWQKMNELLDLYTKNPNKEDIENEQEIL